MSEYKGMSRLGRNVRLAAMIVSAALALPSFAVASHTTCDKQSNEVGPGTNCPEFSPEYHANVGNPVVDSESALNYEISQAAHESQLMRLALYTPDAWQFNTQIRPSAVVGACSGDASRISTNGWGLQIGGTLTRGDAYFSHYDAPTQTIHGCARVGSHQVPFTIAKQPAASAYGWKLSIDLKNNVPTITAAGASLTRVIVDLSQRTDLGWHQNQSLQPERAIFSQASATPTNADLRGEFTTCRRGLDGTTATGCRANDLLTVARTVDAVRIGLAPTVAPVDFGKLTGPTRLPGTGAEDSRAPDARDGFGLVHGSATANVTFTQPTAHPDETVKGYVLVTAIPGNLGSRSGKYVVTKASEPGFDSTVCGTAGTAATCSIALTAGSLPRLDGGSLHPDFDGAGKYDLALVTVYLSGKRTDGKCDDGTVYGTLCAPTIPLWQVRTPRHPDGFDFPVPTGPGTSRWQFLWRTKQYGSVSQELFFDNRSGTTGDGQPFMMLFVDYASKQAEFVIWGSYFLEDNASVDTLCCGDLTLNGALANTSLRTITPGRASDGPGTSFLARSNSIMGDGDTGTVQFNNGATFTGDAIRFDYQGETDPSGTFGTVTITDPTGVNISNSIPPSPSGGDPRGTRIGFEFMEGGAI